MAYDALPLPPAAQLLGTPSHPSPSDRATARVLQLTNQHELPSQWAANKYEQTNKFTGAVAQAIEPYLDAFGGARVRAMRRKPRTVKKSSHGTGHYDRDDEFEPLEPDHPLCQILKNPGGESSSWSMGQELSYLVLQYFLTGDAPAWMPRNAGGRPVQFFALTAATVQAQFTGGSPMYPNGSYLVTPYAGGQTFYAAGMLATGARLPGEEVRFFRRPHPWARNWGMSVLQSAALEIDILEAISRSRWAFFDQAMNLDTIVYVPGAGPDEIDRLKVEMQNRHAGARNFRKALFVGGAGAVDPTGKPLSVQSLSQGAKELDFGSSYEQMAKQIAGFFKVPGLFLGLNADSSSYAADWAAQRRLFDVGLVPAARKLGVFLTQHLAKPWEDDGEELVIEVDIAPPQNVESEQAEKQFALQQGVISVNEYRTATNRKPVEGGDDPQPVFIAKKQQEAQPQPDPAQMAAAEQEGGPTPNMSTDQTQALRGAVTDAQTADPGDPLAGLLGGLDGPQEPVEKARALRKEGEIWDTARGKMTKQNGKIVPYRDPNAAPKEKKPTKKDQAAAAKQEKTANVEKVKAAADKLAAGGADLTAEDVGHLDAHLQTLPAEKLKQVARAIGAKLSGAKKDLAERLMKEARAKVAGGQEPAPEEPAAGKPAAGALPKGPAGVWQAFQGADGSAKEYLAMGLHNGGISNPEGLTKLPKGVDADRLLGSLGGAFQQAHRDGDTGAAAAVARAAELLGGTAHGTPGEVVPFDGSKHRVVGDAPGGVFTGTPVRVKVPGMTHPNSSELGREAEVEPAPGQTPRQKPAPEKPPAAPAGPHEAARAFLGSIGIDHSGLSDEDITARMKAAFAPKPPARPRKRKA